jgi:hypothetical protein
LEVARTWPKLRRADSEALIYMKFFEKVASTATGDFSSIDEFVSGLLVYAYGGGAMLYHYSAGSFETGTDTENDDDESERSDCLESEADEDDER